jgi:hypothetical protein
VLDTVPPALPVDRDIEADYVDGPLLWPDQAAELLSVKANSFDEVDGTAPATPVSVGVGNRSDVPAGGCCG